MLRVLLAEDNPGDVMLVEQSLHEQDFVYELHVVRDGREAMKFIASLESTPATPCPDVFLLDLNLPKVDGHSILQKIRLIPRCSKTPVIIVTSSDAPQDRKRAELFGANAYFRKPSDFAEFMRLGILIRDLVAADNSKVTGSGFASS